MSVGHGMRSGQQGRCSKRKALRCGTLEDIRTWGDTGGESQTWRSVFGEIWWIRQRL